jgi:shikimate kinase
MVKVSNKNIYLIGMMGSGKTTVGKMLAETLNRNFIDIDSLIEIGSDRTIMEIFEQDGEEVFRELESSILGDVSSDLNQIIATGGGIVLNRANCDLMHNTGTCILLYCVPDDLVGRLNNSERPLLESGDSIRISLDDIWESRKELYKNNADFIIDTSGINIADTVTTIIDLL